MLAAAGPIACAEPEAGGEQTARLVRALDAEDRAERDAAEAELEKLGPAALKHLPALDSEKLSAEQRHRLARLLDRLWKAKVNVDVQGTLVTLPEEPTPALDLIASLHKQSGNPISDLRMQFNQDVDNTPIRVAISKRPFWEALDAVLQGANLSIYPHTEDRSIGLVARGEPARPVYYTGAFRITADRILLQRDFRNTEPPICLVDLEVLVEPRLRPVLVEVELDKFSATDDKGRSLDFGERRPITLTMEEGTFRLPLAVRTLAPPRDATAIKRLTGELFVSLPARTEEFTIANLAVGKSASQSSAAIRLHVGPLADSGDGIWTVPVVVERLNEPEPADSHLAVTLENEITLVAKDGKRLPQNGGLSTYQDDKGRSGVEYLFVDYPGQLADYSIEVRIPSGITSVPVPFTFENLPLP